MVALWKYLDHPGLKYLGLLLLAAAFLRLVANPALLQYHPRSAWPVINWLMYTYLAPAFALLASGSVFRRLELERLLPWGEIRPTIEVIRWPAVGCGIAAILLGFEWINLTILDAFSPRRSTGALLRSASRPGT